MECTLVVEAGPQAGYTFTLAPNGTNLLGSGPDARIKLQGLAPRHAALELLASGLLVVDLGSEAGTLLNGDRLAPRVPAHARAGDELTFGPHVLGVDLVGVQPHQGPPSTPGVPTDEFEVVRVLGQGGYGRVYEVRRRVDGRPLAIKVLLEQVGAGSPDHERFQREGTVGTRLRSPFIVWVQEMRVVAGTASIVMELVPGPSARDYLHRLGHPLPIPEALKIGEDVAQALAVAHQAGVIHRDVKPENVLLSPQGMAKLSDFGIAKDLESTLRSLTVSGAGLGTLAYMAPEQVTEAKHVLPSADLYSLGATLFHLVCGRPPFLAEDPGVIARIVDEPPPPLGTLLPDCPSVVANVIHSLLAKDPFDRQLNARTLASRLRELREQGYPGYPLQRLFGSAS